MEIEKVYANLYDVKVIVVIDEAYIAFLPERTSKMLEGNLYLQPREVLQRVHIRSHIVRLVTRKFFLIFCGITCILNDVCKRISEYVCLPQTK